MFPNLKKSSHTLLSSYSRKVRWKVAREFSSRAVHDRTDACKRVCWPSVGYSHLTWIPSNILRLRCRGFPLMPWLSHLSSLLYRWPLQSWNWRSSRLSQSLLVKKDWHKNMLKPDFKIRGMDHIVFSMGGPLVCFFTPWVSNCAISYNTLAQTYDILNGNAFGLKFTRTLQPGCLHEDSWLLWGVLRQRCYFQRVWTLWNGIPQIWR